MQPKPGLWRQTPPAIFPPILGLFGLGLAWRRVTEVYGMPREVGELILGAVSILFLFATLAYLAKFVRRPGVLADDLRILPGRAGLPAASAAAMLFAATLVPYSTCAAKWALGVALLAHLVVATVILKTLWGAPFPQRRMTPVWHLSFVGFIIAPLAAVPLGWIALSDILFFVSLALALTIWGGSLVMLAAGAAVPPPLRPPLAIHLAPVCLTGIVATLLGYETLALIFGWIGIVGMAVLLLKSRYLTQAGFSPFWGAFTFPIAAFANLMLILAPTNGAVFKVLGGMALIGATITIPIIAFKILKMWAAGPLATKTNSAKI